MRNSTCGGLILAAVLSAWGHPAPAAAVQYTWGPLTGGGTYSHSGGPFVPYTTTGGYLDITYDPGNVAGDSVLGYVGDPVDRAFGVVGWRGGFSVTLSGNYLTFSHPGDPADYDTVNAVLMGTPGPLGSDGLPLSLDGFLAEPAGVYAAVGSTFGSGFFFRGSAADAEAIVPGATVREPSSPLMLGLGAGIVALLVHAARRGRSC